MQELNMQMSKSYKGQIIFQSTRVLYLASLDSF